MHENKLIKLRFYPIQLFLNQSGYKLIKERGPFNNFLATTTLPSECFCFQQLIPMKFILSSWSIIFVLSLLEMHLGWGLRLKIPSRSALLPSATKTKPTTRATHEKLKSGVLAAFNFVFCQLNCKLKVIAKLKELFTDLRINVLYIWVFLDQ